MANYALDFNGSTQYATLPAAPIVTDGDITTIEAVVTIDSVTIDGAIAGNWQGSADRWLLYYDAPDGLTPDGWTLVLYSSAGLRRLGGYIATAGETNTVKFVIDRTVNIATMYVDDVLINSISVSSSYNFSDTTYVAQDGAGTKYFNGQIERITISHSVNVASNRNYQFNEGSGITLADSLNPGVNDGNYYNPPANDAQWVLLSGGGGSLQALEPAVIPRSELFEALTLQAGAVTLQPDAILSTESLLVPEVTTGPVSILPSRIESSEQFYSAVVQATGQTFIYPASISSTEALSVPEVLAGAVTVSPSQVLTSEAFYTPSVNVGGVIVSPDTIARSELFGIPVIDLGAVLINPATITRTESVFEPNVRRMQAFIIVEAPIGSTEVFGRPVLIGGDTVVIGEQKLLRDVLSDVLSNVISEVV